MIQCYEAPGRDGTKGGDNPADSVPWVVLGTSSETVAKAVLQASAPAIFGTLYMQDVSVKEIAFETWDGNVRYGPKKQNKEGEYKIAFDTTGGKQKITHSLETIHKYAPPGKTATDHKGAIGVTSHGVEGCEIVTPKFSWTETWTLPAADYGWAYSQVLKAITGKVNSGTFRGFPAGQVLFIGGKGASSSKDPAQIEIAYSYEQSNDVTAQTVGDITGIAKTGWQYLWVQYEETADTTANKYARRPSGVYVEKVYDSIDFSALKVGN